MKLAGACVLLFVVLAIGAAGVAILGAFLFVANPEVVAPVPQVPTGFVHDGPLPGVAAPVAWSHILINLAGYGILLAILAVAFVLALKWLIGNRRKSGSSQEQLNETLMIQEIHAGLSRMEDRIEALETILFDRAAPTPSGHARPKAGRSL